MTAHQLCLRQLRHQEKIIKQLTKFYDSVNDALANQKLGHNNGWTKVQTIADKIEDDFDLTDFRTEK